MSEKNCSIINANRNLKEESGDGNKINPNVGNFHLR